MGLGSTIWVRWSPWTSRISETFFGSAYAVNPPASIIASSTVDGRSKTIFPGFGTSPETTTGMTVFSNATISSLFEAETYPTRSARLEVEQTSYQRHKSLLLRQAGLPGWLNLLRLILAPEPQYKILCWCLRMPECQAFDPRRRQGTPWATAHYTRVSRPSSANSGSYRVTGSVISSGLAQAISPRYCTQTSSKPQDERTNLLSGH
jgi:hypothetical protein